MSCDGRGFSSVTICPVLKFGLDNDLLRLKS
jgi:hypothetical protein